MSQKQGLSGGKSLTSGGTWDPRMDAQKNEREKTEKSYMIGYFSATKPISTKKGDFTMHDFELIEVGDESHLSDSDTSVGDTIGVWGTGVLNDLISKNCVPGVAYGIQWTGSKKSEAGRDYATWDIFDMSEKFPSKRMAASGSIPQGSSFENESSVNTGVSNRVEPSSVKESVNEADDDDLPF